MLLSEYANEQASLISSYNLGILFSTYCKFFLMYIKNKIFLLSYNIYESKKNKTRL